MNDNDFAAANARVIDISSRIRPQLAGNNPALVGSVLLDLVSIWIAGHHPALREEVLQIWLAAVRKMVPVSEAEIFPNGKPPGW